MKPKIPAIPQLIWRLISRPEPVLPNGKLRRRPLMLLNEQRTRKPVCSDHEPMSQAIALALVIVVTELSSVRIDSLT
jgi:hypothetical protein